MSTAPKHRRSVARFSDTARIADLPSHAKCQCWLSPSVCPHHKPDIYAEFVGHHREDRD